MAPSICKANPKGHWIAGIVQQDRMFRVCLDLPLREIKVGIRKGNETYPKGTKHPTGFRAKEINYSGTGDGKFEAGPVFSSYFCTGHSILYRRY